MMQRDQEELTAPATGEEWLTLAGAVARIAAIYTLSRGAALKVLRQAGISDEVSASGIYLGRPCALRPGDWGGSQIDPETGALLLLNGLLGHLVVGQIAQVAVNAADLKWWLERRYAAQGANDAAIVGDLPPSGVRTIRERTAEENCGEWFAALPPKPRMAKAAAFEAAKRQCGEALSYSAFLRIWHAEAGKKGWDKPGRPPGKARPPVIAAQ
jgi:hypothetical protein